MMIRRRMSEREAVRETIGIYAITALVAAGIALAIYGWTAGWFG